MNANANKQDTFYQELLHLVIPIAIQNFMLALVSATDAFMLGFIAQDAMSAVSMAGQVQFFLNILVSGFSVGVGIMTAQYWGKRDIRSIEHIVPIGMQILLVIGGLTMLSALFIPGLLMKLLTSDSVLQQLGTEYLIVVAPSYLFCGITQVYFALLKNTGHAKESSAIGSAAVVLNIILNAVLIFGLLGLPAMGIRGAALATTMTRAAEMILAIMVTRRKSEAQLRLSAIFHAAPPVLRADFYHYTMPVIGAGLVWGIAYMSYSVIMGHLGSDAVAANSITMITRNLLICMIRGVGGGAGIMVGNLLGANELEKAKSYAFRLSKAAAFAGLCTGLCLILISPLITKIVTLTDTAQSYLHIMLVFCALNLMAQSMNHTILDGIFCAGGDSRFDMDTNIVFMWFICLPLGLISAFVLHWPVPVVYCITNLDEIIKLPLVIRRYRKYIWLRNITRD